MESKAAVADDRPVQEPTSGALEAAQPHQDRSMAQYFDAQVEAGHTDLIVLTTCFTTGLIDTTMFAAYNTFVSMQTGNTIFVALGASDQNSQPYGWVRSLLSIVLYSVGALFFSRLNSRLLPPASRRITLMASFAVQTVCILLSAAIIQAGVVDQSSDASVVRWNQLAPIALLSFQAAGQIVASRALGINEVPSVVITSLLCDLFSDPKLLAASNVKRNRRVAGFVLLLLGAIVGGWIYKATHAVQGALWVAGGLKFGIVLAWSFWAKRDHSPT